MQQLLAGIVHDEGPSKRIDEAVTALLNAGLTSEQRDAATTLGSLLEGGISNDRVESYANSGSANKALGKRFRELFELLRGESVDDEVGQMILEAMRKACTAIDADSVQGADGPGTLDGSGGVSFAWIKVPLDNTQTIISDMEMFSTLLKVLERDAKWTRMEAIDLLRTLLDNNRKGTESAIERTPAGMESLVDVLDDEADFTRNKMLDLLDRLTENNEQLQNFVAFRDGFAKLFQIVEKEIYEEHDMIVQNCLSILNNVLRDNQLTQKLFLQGNHLNKVPNVLALPYKVSRARTYSSQSDHGPPEPTSRLPASDEIHPVVLECSPAKMACLKDALDLVSRLASGLCPTEILEQPWFNMDQEFELHTAADAAAAATNGKVGQEEDPALQEELERRRKAHLKVMQSAIGRHEGILQAISNLAFCTPDEDHERSRIGSFGSDTSLGSDLYSISWGELRKQALVILGDIVCSNEAAGLLLSTVQVTAASNSILSSISTEVQSYHSEESVEKRTSICSTLLGSVVMIVLFGTRDAERAAASYLWECLFFENQAAQMSIVGHAITPSPFEMSSAAKADLIAPPAGSLLMDVLAQARGLADAEDSLRVDRFVRAGRLFEALLAGNSSCKELALRVPVVAPNAGFKALSKKVNDMPKSDETLLYGEPLFSAFMRLVTIVAKRLKGPFSLQAKPILIACLRVASSWLHECSAVADELMQSSSGLFLFDMFSSSDDGEALTTDSELQGLAALCVGLCLVPHEGKSAERSNRVLKLVTSRVGLVEFTDAISRLTLCPVFKRATLSLRARKQAMYSHGTKMPKKIVEPYDKRFAHFYNHAKELVQDAIVSTYTSGRDAEIEKQSASLDVGNLDRDMLVERCKSLQSACEEYKNLIRWQDNQVKTLELKLQSQGTVTESESSTRQLGKDAIDSLQRQVDNLEQEKHDAEQQNENLLRRLRELEQQNAAVSVQKSALTGEASDSFSNGFGKEIWATTVLDRIQQAMLEQNSAELSPNKALGILSELPNLFGVALSREYLENWNMQVEHLKHGSTRLSNLKEESTGTHSSPIQNTSRGLLQSQDYEELLHLLQTQELDKQFLLSTIRRIGGEKEENLTKKNLQAMLSRRHYLFSSNNA